MLMTLFRRLIKLLIAISVLIFVAVAILWLRAFSPPLEEAATVYCGGPARSWASSTPLKVMSFNVQYMASKKVPITTDTSNQSATILCFVSTTWVTAKAPCYAPGTSLVPRGGGEC